jgi:hypothetical protein
MGEFLDELAVAAVNHVIVIIDRQLLLTKALVLRINDIVTHQTPLVVVSPVSGIGSKFMLLPNLLSAILTFLVVYRVRIDFAGFLGVLHPCVMAVELLEAVGLFYGELASVKATIVLVLLDASVGQFPVLRFVMMPGEEEVTSTTGMTAANGLILTRRRLAAPDLRPLEHALVEIFVITMAIIDMVLLRYAPP